MSGGPDGRARLLLVSSSGGVLLDLLALEPFWSRHAVLWAVVRAPDTESALARHDVVWLEEQRVSRPLALLRALLTDLRLLRACRPAAVLSAGTGVAAPMFLAAWLAGVPTVWISTLNVVRTPGLAARVCARLATTVLLQRGGTRRAHPRGVLVGELY